MDDAGIELLVEQLGRLPENLHRTLCDALRSQLNDTETIKLIDDRFRESPRCGHCKSSSIHRWSSQNGLSRYRCKACKRTFNALTGTPLAHLHRRDVWFQYAGELVRGSPLRNAAKNCDIALETAFRWRHLFSKKTRRRIKKPRSAEASPEAPDS